MWEKIDIVIWGYATMKSIKRLVLGIAFVIAFAYAFNIQYVGELLNIIGNAAVECVKGGDEYSTQLKEEMDTLSVSKFIDFGFVDKMRVKELSPDNAEHDDVEGSKQSKLQEVFALADNYVLSDDTFNNHILHRHGPNSTYKNKSHFNADFDIKGGIDSTLKGDNFFVGPNTAGRDGYIFEQTFLTPIGVDSKGKSLSTLKVVIDEKGNVITAFPKK